MSEHKHTIGPWYLSGSGYDGVWIMAGTLHVATIPGASDGDWCEANARLIAAAPEMLEALEAAVECLANNGFGKAFVLDLIATVLAKSKGETDE